MLCSIGVVIPEFEKTGLLPVGVHWATLHEIEARYGTNLHRLRLLGGQKRGIHALEVAGCRHLYLNGGFVTAKELPQDYDVCWDAVGVNFSLLDPVLLDFRNQRAAQKAKYLGEFFPAHVHAEVTPPFRIYFEFFQTDKSTGDRKGIIGIALKGRP